jgi:hypothetical protein
VDYLALFLRKLDNPVEIWEHAFRNQLSDRARHLLFILTTLPTECRIADVETAFVSFHNSQCVKFGIAHSTVDFSSALKELDGTFIATRKVQASVLIRFQNPSIRDFMQFLLLGGELLNEVLTSLVFFEQALWFIETLEEEAPQTTRTQLMRWTPQIVAALQRLVDSESCTISVDGHQQRLWVTVKTANPTARIAAFVSASSKHKGQPESKWLAERMTALATKLQAGTLSASSVVGSLDPLKEHGLMESDAGKQLVRALKGRAMNDPSDLDDFETLANVVQTLPGAFEAAEVKNIREAYSAFADRYSKECDISNPDELRDEASRLGDVGDLLQVDTDAAQDTMRESADEIEKEEGSGWDDDDDRRGCGGSSDECSDGELDSMFGTLGG